MAFILSLDQGTTSSRSILFDHGGQLHGTAQSEFTQHFPEPGLVEHDATEIWETQLRTARQVLADTGTVPSDIAAIGITNQRETVVLWDRQTGEPIHRAIVWQDRRTAGFCEDLKAQGHSADIQARTGLVIDAYFSASKLRWLLDEVPGARKRAEAGELCFGTIDTWLIYQLTGKRLHITDASNASRTMLYNIHRAAWDPHLLDLFRSLKPFSPKSSPAAPSTGRPRPIGSARRFPWPASGATSKPRSSGKPVIVPGRPRTPTERAASC